MRTRQPITFRSAVARALAKNVVWFALLAAWLVIRVLTFDPSTTDLMH